MATRASKPGFGVSAAGAGARVRFEGAWSAVYAEEVEHSALSLEASLAKGPVIFDLARLEELDTLGAMLLNRTRDACARRGIAVTLEAASPAHGALLDDIPAPGPLMQAAATDRSALGLLADIGESVALSGHDLTAGISFLGRIVAVLAQLARTPGRMRLTSVVAQIEQVAFRGVPVIVLISFLVGAIVAQQGIFQLNRFGAATFAVDLIGILVMRELGVLLTSIMVAGRSGSAFTAELGSMKMREEIDALRVMGLDPIEILVVPRILALIVGLPLLTLISDFAALFGGQLVAWVYGGVGPDIFLERLQEATSLRTFLAGLIKAPFMALVIGVISCVEGFAVKGSAESLGRHVTEAVVKSIFMVIVVDGVFAMFFAAIRF